MSRAICRCGQQVRTNAKSGAKVQCPRCDAWLDVAERMLDPDRAMDEKRIGSDPGVLLRRTQASNPSEKIKASVGHLDSIGIGRIMLVSLLAAIPLGLMLWAYFGLASSSKKLISIDKPDSSTTAEVGSLGWGQLDWKDKFEAYPNGAQVKQIATKIADSGMLLDPGRFWEQLDVSAFEKNALSPGGSLVAYQEKIPIKQIVDDLKSIPFDTVSKTNEIAHCRWDVLRVHQVPESLGVLVRYFQEPMSVSELVMSDDWISGLRRILSVEEYFNVAKDLYSRRKTSEPNMIGSEKQKGIQEQSTESIFTPYFGFAVLTFSVSEGAVLWSDVTGIPSEVPLSRACGTMFQKDWFAFQKRSRVQQQRIPSGWKAEGIIDVFGEYESPEDQSFARELVFSETKPDSETVARIDRAIPSVSSSRAKELISVALSVTSNYGQLKENVSIFRKNHPKDLGLDVLLLSLWMRHHDSKRSGLTYDDFGVVFVDAADRLFASFKDPTLIDIKARIYWSHSRQEESEEQLSLAQDLGTTSAFFFKRRIEHALEKADKSETLSYLSKFNTFWLSQPAVIIEYDTKTTWNNLVKRWGK